MRVGQAIGTVRARQRRQGHALGIGRAVTGGSELVRALPHSGGKLLRLRLLSRMRAIQRVSGVAIVLFGLWAVFFAR